MSLPSIIRTFVNYLLDTSEHTYAADYIGRVGEKLTARELNIVRLFGRGGKVLRNIYVPTDDGGTSEIDIAFITQKGIFVIESKNYSGWIFGSEKDIYWTAMLPTKEKNKFYNPIMQNNTHIKWLGQYLADDTPLFSMVVFSERCELKKLSIESSDAYVLKRDRLYNAIWSIWEKSEDRLSEEKVDAVYEKLKALTKVNVTTKEIHIENINNKYKKAETSSTEYPSHDSMICPRCGENLILREAKKGSNIGKKFYGCSNYPKCRYLQNVDEVINSQ